VTWWQVAALTEMRLKLIVFSVMIGEKIGRAAPF
jgi:hypothetical protein